MFEIAGAILDDETGKRWSFDNSSNAYSTNTHGVIPTAMNSGS